MIGRRCARMGIRFDQWQADLIRGALAKRANGRYASTVGGVVWSLPRQVGKTFTVGAMLFALAIEVPGLLILWTAHHTRTSGETFRSMQAMARRSKIAPYVEKVYTGAGTESVVFKNGSRILFGARDQGFGLGFAAVDVIVFDEAQRLRDSTRMDMVPATNRPHNPAGALLFYIGTPPRPTDDGEAFSALRAEALAGDSQDGFFVELSADPDADPDDREQWRKANPSYPTHTPEESMLRMRKHLGSEDAWKREALGIWDPAVSAGVISAVSWNAQEDTDEFGRPLSIPVDRFALGIEIGPDLKWASLTLAGQRADGGWHVELVEDQHTKGRGVLWVPDMVESIVAKNPQIRSVVIDISGPIKSMVEIRGEGKHARYYLKRADGSRGIEVHAVTVNELGIGCTSLLSGIVTGDVWHIGQPQLTVAALAAGKRALGDTGMWVWSRKTADSDITPVQAGTYALIGAQLDKPRAPKRVSSGNPLAGKVVTW